MSGCAKIELPGRRIVAVALLGDGQRHDVHGGIGDAREHAVALGAEKQRLAHRADHARTRPRRALLEHRVEAILRRERVRRARRLEAHAADAPVRIAREHAVGVDRLVRAVERAEPEMDDADATRGDVVVGTRDGRRERPASVGERQRFHRVRLARADVP